MSRWHSRWLRTKNDSKKETGLQDRQVLVPNFMQILLQTIEPNKLLNRTWVRHSSSVRCFWVMKRLIAVKRWTIKCHGCLQHAVSLAVGPELFGWVKARDDGWVTPNHWKAAATRLSCYSTTQLLNQGAGKPEQRGQKSRFANLCLDRKVAGSNPERAVLLFTSSSSQ